MNAGRLGKAILLALAVMLLGALGGFAAWFHAGEPPGCTDPHTLAMVHESFVRHHLPPSARMVAIRTLAGGPLALRFVCQAQLIGIHKTELPPDTPVPGEIIYTSQLTDHRTRHEVTVRIEPLLRWEKAQ
jgi:hypothetical protein